MKQYFKKIPFFAVLAIACFILAGISILNSSKHTQQKQTTPEKKIVPIEIPPAGGSTLPTKNTISLSPALEVELSPTSIPTSQPQPQKQTQSPTETKPPQTSATLTINEPDGNTNYQISISGNVNPCNFLNLARDQGKIKSVTIKTYGPPLNSDYVQELNGYQNNWTFSLNGETKPTGCSNYKVNPSDTVLWKFN